MSTAEWSAYTADTQYLRRLAPANVSVQLNLADPRQHNIVMTRLKLVGKSADNSPHLFELLEARRQAQVAWGLKAGTFAPAIEAAPAGRITMHYIEQADVGNRQASVAALRIATPLQISGAASSTFPGGSNYTYVDISASAVNGTPVAPAVYREEFENPDGNTGANVTISTTGSSSASSFTRYTFESYKFEDTGDSFTDSYVHTEVGSNAPQTPAAFPQLDRPVIDAPVDSTGPMGAPDNLISVCMDRSWTNDCDYIVNTGSVIDHRVKMPLKGHVTLITDHIFNDVAIGNLRTALDANMPPPPGMDPGLVKLVMQNVGGGCDVDANGAVFAGMSGFWHYTTLSSDKKTLYWDITGTNAIFFDEGCSLIQHDVKLTLRIPAPVKSVPDGTDFGVSFSISNDPDTARAEPLPPTTITNSCLAAGTQIQLSTGKLVPIESLTIGQKIFNPYASHAHSLTVEDTAKGVESAPMVRIRDEAGSTLLMTEMHPIATPDRGMVQARALRTGDVVMTTRGPSKLVEVSHEPYGGKVYNLKVGSQTEKASLGQDQTVVYANGFVVGDGQIQSKYEELSMKQGSRTSPEQVPEDWRRDYQLSTSRK